MAALPAVLLSLNCRISLLLMVVAEPPALLVFWKYMKPLLL